MAKTIKYTGQGIKRHGYSVKGLGQPFKAVPPSKLSPPKAGKKK